MKTLLLIFSTGLTKQFRLINPIISKENDFIIEFMICERSDVSSILNKYEENYKYETLEYLTLENISINDILKFKSVPSSPIHCIAKYDKINFNENHDFIYINNCSIENGARFLKREFEEIYKRYIKDHPIESIDYLKFDYRSDEDRISELINEKFHELSFHVSIFKIIDSKIDELKTELLEIIESKFKEIETKINKYF